MIVKIDIPGEWGRNTYRVMLALEPTVYADYHPNWTALACWHLFEDPNEYPISAHTGDDGRLVSSPSRPWSVTPEQGRRIRELAAEYRLSAALSEACAFGAEVIGL